MSSTQISQNLTTVATRMEEPSAKGVIFCEKSNKSTEKKITKRGRTKNLQFDLIADFYSQHNEALIDTTTFERLWNDLTVKLNSVGPPVHSNVEWKRVWSEHKYNKKRKLSSIESELIIYT